MTVFQEVSQVQYDVSYEKPTGGGWLQPDAPHHITVITLDTSGSWGFGAFMCDEKWFQLQWPE